MFTTEQLRAALAALGIDPTAALAEGHAQFPAIGSTVDTAGVDTAGVDTAGVDTAGVDTAGVDTAGVDTAGVDHAVLAALLWRTLGAETRRATVEADTLRAFMHRWKAISPQSVTVPGIDPNDETKFIAHWLEDLLHNLTTRDTPTRPDGSVNHDVVPTLLSAAAHAAEAIKTLLEIRADPSDDQVNESRYGLVGDRLTDAHALAARAHAGAEVVPFHL